MAVWTVRKLVQALVSNSIPPNDVRGGSAGIEDPSSVDALCQPSAFCSCFSFFGHWRGQRQVVFI